MRARISLPALGLLVGLGIVAAVAALAYRHVSSLDDRARWVAHTHDVLEASHATVVAVGDAGRARRAFAMSRDAAELVPYRSALVRVTESQRVLRQLIADNAAQQLQRDQIDAVVAARIDQLETAVREARSHVFNAEAEAALTNGAIVLTGRLAKLTGEFDAQERGLLERRTAAMHAETQSVKRAIAVGFGGSIVILFLSFLLSHHEVIRRRELERFRDEYVGYISHDLKNPLSVIMLQARVLTRVLAGHAMSDAEQSVKVIAESAAFIDKLVRELLEMAYVESDHLEIHAEPIELAGFLQSILEHAVSTSDRARVRLEIAQPATVSAEASRLERVVVNFVHNAVKYSPPGSAVLVRLAVQGGCAVVSVTDHGPGLALEDRSFVFEKYARAVSARKTEGLGLGLYISRKIIEAHGGEIGVNSTPGQGATFFLRLPQIAPVPAAGTRLSAPMPPRGELDGLKVLVVDDEVNAVSALAALLGDEGLDVTSATSGEQALALATASPPDVAVLDLQMPGMTGLTLLQRLRENDRAMPAIIMSGHMESHAQIVAARETGGVAYLGKPVDLPDLLRTLSRIMRPRPAEVEGSRGAGGPPAR